MRKNKFLDWKMKYIILLVIIIIVYVKYATGNYSPNIQSIPTDNDYKENSNELLEMRTWNSKSYPAENNQITTTFHSKWIHYLGEKGWSDIDTNFYENENGFEMTNAPFLVFAPKYSTGVSTFYNNNKWDLFNKKEISEEPLSMTITALEVRNVTGKIMQGDLLVPTGIQKNVSYVIYENAYPEGDLIYYVDFGKAPRLEKLIKINSKPTRLKYEFNLWYSSPVGFEISNGKKWDEEGILETDGNQLKSWKEGSNVRGIAFKQFRIWDSNTSFAVNHFDKRNIAPIQSKFISKGENEYILVKELPQTFFDNNPIYPVFTDTVSTFYPDADPETNTVDGWAYGQTANSDFSTVRNQAGTYAYDTNTELRAIFESDIPLDQYNNLQHSFILFDTSFIGSTSTISSAVFSGYGSERRSNLGETDAHLASSYPSSNTAIVASDYQKVGRVSFGSITYGLFSVSQYNNITLNSNGINNISKTGITKFSWQLGWDINNFFDGTWVSNDYTSLTIKSADTTGTSQDPILTITYTPYNPSGLNCTIVAAGSCSGANLLYLKNDTGGYWNAHAQLPSIATYPYAICCDASSKNDTINTTCIDSTFLKLYATTNSHVQIGTRNEYSNSACINAVNGLITCRYYNTSCNANYTCLASIASSNVADNTTNAHVGDCNEYSLKVCCGLNSPPNRPELILPANNSIITNRTPNFSWNATDPENDPLSYDLFIVCNGGCSVDNRNYLGLSATNYTIPSELRYFGDDNYYYTWYVRAYDGNSYSQNSTIFKFTLNSLVSLTLFNNSINFGAMDIGIKANTTNNTFPPFALRNDGNCFVDVNISADKLLWDSKNYSSKYFQYKVDNYTTEMNSFNWTGSVTYWSYVPNSNQTFINMFNYSDATDTSEVDILVEVPLDEPSGNKSATVTFTGRYVRRD